VIYDQMYYVTYSMGSTWAGITDYFPTLEEARKEDVRLIADIESYRSFFLKNPADYARVTVYSVVDRSDPIDRWTMVKHKVWVHDFPKKIEHPIYDSDNLGDFL